MPEQPLTPSVFTRIMRGELPARFVWSDDRAVAFLAASPIADGHTLVVPRQQVDHWIDLDPALLQHLALVAREVGRAIQRAFQREKVGLVIVGLEVRHVHIHLSPIDTGADFDFSRQDPNPDPARLDAAAEHIRAALRELGHEGTVAG